MKETITTLLSRFARKDLQASVIPWGSPIPSFGDLMAAKVATLGLNPSNREFVDVNGAELDGGQRRFHTLRSLNLARWADATSAHLELIAKSCEGYFANNPYDMWFRKLEYVMSGTGASYYASPSRACHLDLVPYATARKWTVLSQRERRALLGAADDTLGLLLQHSPIRVLILNGSAVVSAFEKITHARLTRKRRVNWTLPHGIEGFSFEGIVQSICGIELCRPVRVVGYNHNIQSSFGVTRQVTSSIQRWIGRATLEAFA
jgi:hypothetical protein